VVVVRGTTITIPDEVDLAIRAEAYRVGCRPGEVLVSWLRATFPAYVQGQLRRDLSDPPPNKDSGDGRS